jgi:uncharacterized protein
MQQPLAFHLLAKPTGAICNLDCKYCFFLSKDRLYGGGALRMADDVLEAYVSQLLASQPHPEVNIAWQGGEPTLMGLDFFRRSIELVAEHKRPGQKILHTIQTNGVLLNDEWARFFKAHNFLVGLSVDGPKIMHDAYRVAKGGRGTFDQVMRAWECLMRHEVDVNVLCTVHAANGDHGLEVYRFFRDRMQAKYLQFIPIVERATEDSIDQANQHNGDLYACDHYVEPDYLLGNISETPLAELVASPKQRRFGRDKFDTLPKYCCECDVLFACYGECPRNRFVDSPDGEAGLNYLCAGYKMFFRHIDPPMRAMVGLLRCGRFADEIMTMRAGEPA